MKNFKPRLIGYNPLIAREMASIGYGNASQWMKVSAAIYSASSEIDPTLILKVNGVTSDNRIVLVSKDGMPSVEIESETLRLIRWEKTLNIQNKFVDVQWYDAVLEVKG